MPTVNQNTNAPTEPIVEQVCAAAVGDLPAEHDDLGFGAYVGAVAEFLASPDTIPPFCLSVEGEWGSGKSSFMLQLENRLKETAKAERKQALVVRFNPWRYEQEDAVWSAFALEFHRQLARQLPWWRRPLCIVKLLGLRFSWKEGWADAVKFIAFWVAMLFGTVALAWLAYWYGLDRIEAFTNSISKPVPASGVAGSLLTVSGIAGLVSLLSILFGKLKKIFGDPLKLHLTKYAQGPDYSGRLAFIARFHEDFNKVVDAYAGKNKVFVFIDDLDRCEATKSADLIAALNLMLSESASVIFILGIDRDKIAAAIAVKHEKLLPYFAPSEAGMPFNQSGGLEYGYGFLEKFIQLAVRVPKADEQQVTGFLRILFSPQESSKSSDPAIEKIPAGLRIALGPESSRTQSIVLTIAPYLNYNPRRIKQFINLFRLQAYIAYCTGLFDPQEGETPLTLEKLGKFVALSLRWPLLMEALDSDPNLLT